MSKIAYSVKEAAEAVGLSQDTIKRAINAGDLVAHAPRIEGRQIARQVIRVDELERWLNDDDRKSA